MADKSSDRSPDKADRRGAKPGAGDTIKISRNSSASASPAKPTKIPNDADAPALIPPPGPTKANKAVVMRKSRKAAPAANTAAAAPLPSPAKVAESAGAGTAIGIGPIAVPHHGSDRRPVKSINERAPLIQLAAYFRAEKRGFSHGLDQADWFAAEREVDGMYRFV